MQGHTPPRRPEEAIQVRAETEREFWERLWARVRQRIDEASQKLRGAMDEDSRQDSQRGA
jgi:hypothetical protein